MKFISVMPQDILYRLQPYDDEMMNDIKVAADKANEQATDAFMAKMAEKEIIGDELNAGGYHG
jgi:hypothetical protein